MILVQSSISTEYPTYSPFCMSLLSVGSFFMPSAPRVPRILIHTLASVTDPQSVDVVTFTSYSGTNGRRIYNFTDIRISSSYLKASLLIKLKLVSSEVGTRKGYESSDYTSWWVRPLRFTREKPHLCPVLSIRVGTLALFGGHFNFYRQLFLLLRLVLVVLMFLLLLLLLLFS